MCTGIRVFLLLITPPLNAWIMLGWISVQYLPLTPRFCIILHHKVLCPSPFYLHKILPIITALKSFPYFVPICKNPYNRNTNIIIKAFALWLRRKSSKHLLIPWARRRKTTFPKSHHRRHRQSNLTSCCRKFCRHDPSFCVEPEALHKQPPFTNLIDKSCWSYLSVYHCAQNTPLWIHYIHHGHVGE